MQQILQALPKKTKKKLLKVYLSEIYGGEPKNFKVNRKNDTLHSNFDGELDTLESHTSVHNAMNEMLSLMAKASNIYTELNQKD